MFRYVDMIANPEVADIFRKRAKVGHLLSPSPNVRKDFTELSRFIYLFLFLNKIYILVNCKTDGSLVFPYTGFMFLFSYS